jgi:hypothetical protein
LIYEIIIHFSKQKYLKSVDDYSFPVDSVAVSESYGKGNRFLGPGKIYRSLKDPLEMFLDGSEDAVSLSRFKF